jgi:hypothetical protein
VPGAPALPSDFLRPYPGYGNIPQRVDLDLSQQIRRLGPHIRESKMKLFQSFCCTPTFHA